MLIFTAPSGKRATTSNRPPIASMRLRGVEMAGARRLLAAFGEVRITTVLTHGDLLESGAGQRHRGAALDLARKVWPQGLIRRFLPGAGLFMLIEAKK